MKRSIVRQVSRFLLLMLVFAVPVWAAQAPLPPITMPSPGQFACPSCAVETSPTNHGLPVWGTTQEFGVIGPDASTTKVLCSAGATSDPLFCSLTLGFIPSDTATNWAAKIGTPTGTGEFVRAAAPTVTGNWTLPADFIDTITEIAAPIKAGDGTKLATTTTPGANGNLVKWDTAGKLIDGGAPTAGTAAIINFESQFPIPAGDVTTFVSAGSNISATSAQAQSLAVENMTLGSPCCFVYTAAPGTAMVVTLNSGTYGGALTPSSVTVTLTAANTAVCDSTNSLAVTAGQGYHVDVNGDAGTAEGQLRGGCKRTA